MDTFVGVLKKWLENFTGTQATLRNLLESNEIKQLYKGKFTCVDEFLRKTFPLCDNAAQEDVASCLLLVYVAFLRPRDQICLAMQEGLNNFDESTQKQILRFLESLGIFQNSMEEIRVDDLREACEALEWRSTPTRKLCTPEASTPARFHRASPDGLSPLQAYFQTPHRKTSKSGKLKCQICSGGMRLKQLQMQLEEADCDKTAFLQSQKEAKDTVNDLEQKCATEKRRNDNLSMTISNLEEELHSRQAEIATMQSTLETSDRQNKILTEDVQFLEKSLADVRKDRDYLEEVNTKLNIQVTSLQTTLEGQDDALQTAKMQVAELLTLVEKEKLAKLEWEQNCEDLKSTQEPADSSALYHSFQDGECLGDQLLLHAQEEVANLTALTVELQKLRDEHVAVIAEKEDRIRVLTCELNALNQSLNDVMETRSSLEVKFKIMEEHFTSEVNSLQATVTLNNDKLLANAKEVDALKQELGASEKLTAALQAQLDAVTNKQDKLKAELAETNASNESAILDMNRLIEGKNRDVEKLSKKNSNLSSEVRSLNKLISNLKTTIANEKASKEEINIVLVNINKEMATACEASQRNLSELHSMKKEAQRLSERLHEVEAFSLSQTEKIDNLQTRLTESTRVLHEKQIYTEECETKISDLKAQVEKLSIELETNVKSLTNVKESLDKANKKLIMVNETLAATTLQKNAEISEHILRIEADEMQIKQLTDYNGLLQSEIELLKESVASLAKKLDIETISKDELLVQIERMNEDHDRINNNNISTIDELNKGLTDLQEVLEDERKLSNERGTINHKLSQQVSDYDKIIKDQTILLEKSSVTINGLEVRCKDFSEKYESCILELKSSNKTVNDLTEELATEKSSNQRLQNEIATLQHEHEKVADNFTKEIESQRLTLERIQQEFDNIRCAIDERDSSIELMKKQLLENDATISETTATLEKARGVEKECLLEISVLKSEVEEAKERNQQYIQEVNSLISSLADIDTQLIAEKAASEMMQKENISLKEENVNINEKLECERRLRSVQESVNEDLKIKADENQNVLRATNIELEEVIKLKVLAENRIVELITERDRLSIEIDTANARIEQQTAEVEDIQCSLSNLETKLATDKLLSEQLHAEIDSLKEVNNKLNDELESKRQLEDVLKMEATEREDIIIEKQTALQEALDKIQGLLFEVDEGRAHLQQKAMECNAFKESVSDLNNKLVAEVTVQQALREELESLKIEHENVQTALNSEISAMKEAEGSMKKELEAAHRESSERDAMNEALKNKISENEEIIKDKTLMLEMAQTELLQSEAKIKQLTTNIEELHLNIQETQACFEKQAVQFNNEKKELVDKHLAICNDKDKIIINLETLNDEFVSKLSNEISQTTECQHRLIEVEKRCEELTSELKTSEDTSKHLKNLSDAADAEQNKLISELEEALSSKQSELVGLLSNVEQAELKIKEIMHENIQLDTAVKSLTNELKLKDISYEEKNFEVETALKQMQEDLKVKQQLCKEQNELQEALNERIKEYEQIIDEKTAALEIAQKEIEEAQNKIGKLTVAVEEANARLDQKAKEMDSMIESVTELNTKLTAEVSGREAMSYEIDSLKSEINQLRADVEDGSARIEQQAVDFSREKMHLIAELEQHQRESAKMVRDLEAKNLSLDEVKNVAMGKVHELLRSHGTLKQELADLVVVSTAKNSKLDQQLRQLKEKEDTIQQLLQECESQTRSNNVYLESFKNLMELLNLKTSSFPQSLGESPDSFSYAMSRVNEEVNAVKLKLNETLEQLNNAGEDYKALERRALYLAEMNAKLSTEVLRVKNSSSDALKQKEGDLTSLKTTVSQLNSKIQQLTIANSELNAAMSAVTAKNVELDTQLADMKNDHDLTVALYEKHSQANKAVIEILKTSEEITQTLHRLRSDVPEMVTVIAALERQRREIAVELAAAANGLTCAIKNETPALPDKTKRLQEIDKKLRNILESVSLIEAKKIATEELLSDSLEEVAVPDRTFPIINLHEDTFSVPPNVETPKIKRSVSSEGIKKCTTAWQLSPPPKKAPMKKPPPIKPERHHNGESWVVPLGPAPVKPVRKSEVRTRSDSTSSNSSTKSLPPTSVNRTSRAPQQQPSKGSDFDVVVRQLKKEKDVLSKECQFWKEKAAEAQNQRTKEKEEYDNAKSTTRQRFEKQLEAMKAEMKKLYNQEMGKHKAEQSRLASELKVKNEELLHENATLKEDMDDLRNQLWTLGDKYLQQQSRNTDCSDLSKRLDKINLMPSDAWSINNIKEEVDGGIQGGIGQVNSLFPSMPVEDEDEVFDNRYLDDLKSGIREPSGTARLTELQIRNSMVPPHLKSSYPAETQFVSPGTFSEDTLRTSALPFVSDSLTDSSGDPSMTRSLIPAEKSKKKEQTSYKRPGPPTPSKNGRPSLSGEVRILTPRVPLRDQNIPEKSRGTPSVLKSLFRKRESMGGQDENAAPSTPRGKRLGIFPRKPFGGRDF